jgi:basic amino acid/polyamine antiporter, APA family
LTAPSPKLFVRNATGLVREFSATDSLLMASACVFALVFTTQQFAWFYGNTGGANLPLSLLIAAVPFAFLMIGYWAIGLAMPRTGSDYVWVSRIFSPSIGFAWGLLYMIVVLLVGFVAQISAFASAFSVSLTTSGIVGNSASLSNLGNYLGGTQGTFELGVLFILIFGVFAIFGTRYVKGVIYVSWVAAIVGIILMWYILSTANPTSFEANWNLMLANNPASGLNASASYHALYVSAVNAGAPASPAVGISPAIAALPLSSLFLFGGTYINGFAGEIKNVKKSIPIALFLSLIGGLVYWIVTSQLTVNAVSTSWITAVGNHWDNVGAPAYGLPFNPTQPLMLAVIAYPNTSLISVMFFTYLAGSIAPLFIYFWIPTRYFFSWSFDRAIPSKFADISTRFNTPYIAIVAVAILSIIFSGVYEFAGWSSTFTVGSVAWSLAYVIPGLALLVFPFVKKDLFAQAPGFVKAKVGGLPLISVVGLIMTISFAYIGYIGYISPAVTNQTYGLFGFEVLATVVIIGFITYFASKAYYKSKGIDISLAFKEIPPE